MTLPNMPDQGGEQTKPSSPIPELRGAYSNAALWTAVWAGKATAALSRISGRGGGTTLPGDVARIIDPNVLRKLTKDLKLGSIVITGTNGKTTTSRLVSWLLEGAGHRVVSNRSGANLIFGITAATLKSAGATGHLRADWGVFEIDEASLPKAIDEIQPRAALVLNLFRDQLDRYGELESIAKKIEGALAKLPPRQQSAPQRRRPTGSRDRLESQRPTPVVRPRRHHSG